MRHSFSFFCLLCKPCIDCNLIKLLQSFEEALSPQALYSYAIYTRFKVRRVEVDTALVFFHIGFLGTLPRCKLNCRGQVCLHLRRALQGAP